MHHTSSGVLLPARMWRTPMMMKTRSQHLLPSSVCALVLHVVAVPPPSIAHQDFVHFDLQHGKTDAAPTKYATFRPVRQLLAKLSSVNLLVSIHAMTHRHYIRRSGQKASTPSVCKSMYFENPIVVILLSVHEYIFAQLLIELQ